MAMTASLTSADATNPLDGSSWTCNWTDRVAEYTYLKPIKVTLQLDINRTWTSNPPAQLAVKQHDLESSKLGQTGLVFGSWSEFISRSEHEGLQASTCSGYDLCHPG